MGFLRLIRLDAQSAILLFKSARLRVSIHRPTRSRSERNVALHNAVKYTA